MKIDKPTIASELIIEATEMKGKRPTQLNFEELIDVVESVVKKLTIPVVGSSTSSVIKITNVDIQLIKRQWWEVYKKGWHKHQDFYNRKWWIKYNG